MTTIHHATVKRAAKMGVEFVEMPDGGFSLKNIETQRLSVESWDSVSEALEELKADHVTWEAPHKGNLCGVMARTYHERYESNAHGPGSCDGLDMALRDQFTDPEKGVKLDELRALGMELGLWNDRWDTLNPGMQRMNLSNRIRCWLRNNADAKLKIGKTTGRFGVVFRPAKAARKLAA